MEEALAAIGLATSILQFVNFSSKVLARLHEFHSSVQKTPRVFQDITIQLPLIIKIMTWIEERFRDGSLLIDAHPLV